MQQVLLHVGYHKTATTWMQNLLFTPAHGYSQIAGHEDVFTHVVRPHGLRFDPEPMRDLITRQLAALSGDVIPVISSEVLSGHPFQGGHQSDIYAERLHKIIPNARILISIRAQLKILPSVYMQYVLRGGKMPYDRFFAGEKEIGYFGFTPEHFEYDLLVGYYQKLFGRDKVYILTQESLAQDMQAAAQRLATFAGNTRFSGLQPAALKVYAPSYPEYTVPLLRRINHVQESTLDPTPIIRLGRTPKGLYRAAGYLLRRPPFSTILHGRKPVSNHVRNLFSGYYDDSNRRLSELSAHTIDLSVYR